MSFVRIGNKEIENLSALAAAVRRLGGIYEEGKQTYLAHEGRLACLHEIRLPDNITVRGGRSAYSIGVVPHATKADRFDFAYDTYGGSLEAFYGPNLDKLVMHSNIEHARQIAERNGMTFTTEDMPDGRIIGRARAHASGLSAVL